ncbi:MAG: HEAT repeat domain-containing protein [Anaerolineaceae bacterium]|jgi:HEAT repeat protein
MEYSQQPDTLRQVIEDLLDKNQELSLDYPSAFSDLEAEGLALVKQAWPRIAPDRRLALLVDLEQFAEMDTLVNFDEIGRFALTDPDPRARAAAIRLLWEDQDPHLIPVYIKMMERDEDEQVRAAAAKALGLYVYLGEIEEISTAEHQRVEDRLLSVMSGSEPVSIRQNALASLGYSGRDEVPPLIQAAYDSGERQWVISALQAMGRSADTRWANAVLLKIDHPIPEIQFEAVRAAGHLELAAARQPLLEMVEDRERVTDEVRTAAIWSLTQIGGEEVRVLLEQLIDESEDEEDIEYLEGALENLEFTDGFPVFDMFDFDEEENTIDVINLDDIDDEESNDDRVF